MHLVVTIATFWPQSSVDYERVMMSQSMITEEMNLLKLFTLTDHNRNWKYIYMSKCGRKVQQPCDFF